MTLERARKTDARETAEVALLDAAERLLLEQGHAAITTRKLAGEAGLNHGLVHYYYGSVENVLVHVLKRFTQRLTERQREMYAADLPFIEKWRTAMRYLAEDAPYQKIWFELQALAWNNPELKQAVADVNSEWRAVLTDALAEPHERYGIPMPLDALVSLVMTFNEGIILERLLGVDTGQRELLDWIDAWMAREEAE
jgi:AcrR family transcriptional regulator